MGGFAAARTAAAGNPAQLDRIDRARLSVYYVLMLRWDEMYAYATRHDAPWPIEPTLGAAFQAFSAVANKTAEVLRCHFVGYAFVPLDTPYYGGRCAVGPFGQPKGATTAN